MQARISHCLTVLLAAFGAATIACESGGVGDPCIPEDEYRTNFSGFNEQQVNIESRSYQCETRVCLAANFRGRVSCPYGNPEGTIGPNGQPTATQPCFLPGTRTPIDAPVAAQLKERRAEKAVYCSCRCDGPDPAANYCECPSGYVCQELVDPGYAAVGVGNRQLTGSYCVKDGTVVTNPSELENSAICTGNDCGETHPFSAN